MVSRPRTGYADVELVPYSKMIELRGSTALTDRQRWSETEKLSYSGDVLSLYEMRVIVIKESVPPVKHVVMVSTWVSVFVSAAILVSESSVESTSILVRLMPNTSLFSWSKSGSNFLT